MIEDIAEVSVSPETSWKIPEALVVLGVGGNTQIVGRKLGHKPERHPVIVEETMRRNAIAAAELDRLLAPGAVIIPTGKGTELVDRHYQTLAERQKYAGKKPADIYIAKNDLGHIDRQKFIGFPENEDELKITAQVTQAELMEDLMGKVRTKYAQKTGQIGKLLVHEVWPEKLARNTILNLIEALNMLDEKATGVWEGKMIILTTNSGHLQRTEEIAKALDLEGCQMLSSEQTLLQMGYDEDIDPERINKLFEMNQGSVRENEKNLRGTREIPEFLIPELVYIKNDARLKKTLSHLGTIYYQQYPEAVGRALKSFKIENYQELSAEEIRKRIGQVGLDRTRLAYQLLTDEQKRELGIEGTEDLEKIRLKLAGGVKPAQMIADKIKEAHPDDSEFLTSNGLVDIVDKEWWRIKNWLFGRILPPSNWGNQASVDDWNGQNIRYNQQTVEFIQSRKSVSLSTSGV